MSLIGSTMILPDDVDNCCSGWIRDKPQQCHSKRSFMRCHETEIFRKCFILHETTERHV